MRNILVMNLAFTTVVSLLAMMSLHVIFQAIIMREINLRKSINPLLRREIIDQFFFCEISRRIGFTAIVFSAGMYCFLILDESIMGIFFMFVGLLVFFALGVSILIEKLHWATEVNRYPQKGGMIHCYKQMPEGRYSIILIEGFGDDQRSTEYPLSKEAFRKIEEKRGTVFRSPVVAFADPENGDEIVFLACEISTRKSNYAVL